MVTFLFYTKGSENERAFEGYTRELHRLGVEYELIDADSPRGIMLTEDYDLTQRPSVVVAGPDGTAIERWMGELPLATDVSYLYHR